MIHKKKTFWFLCIYLFLALGSFSSTHAHDYVKGGGSSPEAPKDDDENPYPGEHEDPDDTDPVRTATGELVRRRVDFRLPGRMMDVGIEFTYRSRSAYNGFFGYGWDMNYNRRVKKTVGGSVIVLTGEIG